MIADGLGGDIAGAPLVQSARNHDQLPQSPPGIHLSCVPWTMESLKTRARVFRLSMVQGTQDRWMPGGDWGNWSWLRALWTRGAPAISPPSPSAIMDRSLRTNPRWIMGTPQMRQPTLC